MAGGIAARSSALRYEDGPSSTTPLALGPYLRSILTGEATDGEFAEAAASSPLWGQYDPGAVDWLDGPDDLPDSSLVLAFQPLG